jgi:predicted MFS family arabinose efflux permease
MATGLSIGGVCMPSFWLGIILIMIFSVWLRVLRPPVGSGPRRIFWGASNISGPAITAYIVTAVTDKNRVASVVTFVFSTFTFSYIFAPAVGSFLAIIAGMRAVLLLSTLLIVASTCVFIFIHSQHPQDPIMERLCSSARSVQRSISTSQSILACELAL